MIPRPEQPHRELAALPRAGVLAVLALALCAGSAASATPVELVPVGSEFQVNTYTPGFQLSPDVAVTGDDGFVVAWEGYVPARARRFDSGGEALGLDFRISSDTSLHFEGPPSVVGSGPSGFTIAWATRPISEDWNIVGRDFDDDGLPAADDFLIAMRPDDLEEASIAARLDGTTSLVSWQRNIGGPIEARVYGENCPMGCEAFGLNPESPPSIRHETIATADGGFLAVWEEAGTAGIFAQRISPDGALRGDPIQLDNGIDSASRTSAGAGEDGTSLVAWTAPGIIASNLGAVVARRVGPAGALIESQLQLSDPGVKNSQRASVSSGDAAGTFMVVWRDGDNSPYLEPGIDGSGHAIGRLDRDGEPMGSPMIINEYTTGNQDDPSVARNSRGHYLVVWESPGSTGDDNDGKSIAGRFYRDNSGIFRDDFEDGTLGSWSPGSPER